MSHEEIIKRARRRPLFQPGPSTRPVDIGRAQIEQMLPHRDPMLLVDRISQVDLEQRAMRAHRRILPEDPVLRGHFPGHPVYPGCLLVEAIGQASLCLHHLLEAGRTHVLGEDRPAPVRLLRISQGLFLAEALPGDELVLLCRRLEADGFTAVCAGQALRGETICAVALMEVYLVGGEGETEST
ncbi:MAG: beta-hydroxyacyl-ACP dehydratase [Deltaproteobacteria bacterium]|nr:beta-hydroxyacyl-ACP dehydratase [Deltaproteobacteria bacterium]